MLIQNIRSQHFVLKLRPIFTGIGIFAPAILVILMFSVVSHEKDEDYKSDPNFQFGITENFVSLILLSLSFLTTLISMILNQRWRRNRLSSTPRASSNTDDPTRYLLEDEVYFYLYLFWITHPTSWVHFLKENILFSRLRQMNKIMKI